MVIPSDDPTEAARAIHLALQSAGVQPADLDYVNAHAAGSTMCPSSPGRIPSP
jgi:3-oxoacyl-(acyl-carrier-protein) synthase